MIPVPQLGDIVVFGLVAWAINTAICHSAVGAPIRGIGQWALMLPGVAAKSHWSGQVSLYTAWALLMPFRAAAVCTFCTSWWTSAVGAAAAILSYGVFTWSQFAVVVAAGVAVVAVIDTFVATRPLIIQGSPDDRLKEMLKRDNGTNIGGLPPPFKL